MKPYYKDSLVTLYQGDSFSTLSGLDTDSVECVVTSPPYWRMRDYHMAGQVGNEETLDEYLAIMTDVFMEVHRVLRPDGTLWLNIGDSYASGGWGTRSGKSLRYYSKTYTEREKVRGWKHSPRGLKHKDLIGLPWRVAFSLQEAGWYLRSDIIWHKSNPLPDSTVDRPGKTHEHIFLLSKSAQYYYDADAIRVPTSPKTHDQHKRRQTKYTEADRTENRAHGSFLRCIGKRLETRNRRDVWTVPVGGYSDAHFATFPPKLIEPCILAGCPRGGTVLDPFVGSGTTCYVAKEHGRKSIGIELNPDYLQMAQRRVRQEVLAYS